ncbi:DVUA0089 family protein [Roseateles sp.]|uniref:DVUA0089 family protein n=1 Tax=Roseateles sp. TaxID=1971397 RepID=UPI00326517CA
MAAAPAQTFSGRFDDPANPALVGADLGAAAFGDAGDVANNVALYSFTVAALGTVNFASTGFEAGGADPYFSLFKGTGGAATFLLSNYDQAFSTGGDFAISAALAPGAYQLAMGTFANLSFAENSGSGTLADGFTGLGGSGFLGNARYSLNVSSNPVPEPATWALLALGLAAVSAWQRRLMTRQ